MLCTVLRCCVLYNHKTTYFQSIGPVGEEQKTQFREFSKIYNQMSELCFNVCVWDFGTNEVMVLMPTHWIAIIIFSSSRFETEKIDAL